MNMFITSIYFVLPVSMHLSCLQSSFNFVLCFCNPLFPFSKVLFTVLQLLRKKRPRYCLNVFVNVCKFVKVCFLDSDSSGPAEMVRAEWTHTHTHTRTHTHTLKDKLLSTLIGGRRCKQAVCYQLILI